MTQVMMGKDIETHNQEKEPSGNTQPDQMMDQLSTSQMKEEKRSRDKEQEVTGNDRHSSIDDIL